ncbi:hypothetical protein [Streptomyces sp. NPDC059979]|uniref:hypothetical protein n=1 Tax=Streptomyces sp. NPDC059979 TaxID=3347021 RepID=UPI0036AA2AA2
MGIFNRRRLRREAERDARWDVMIANMEAGRHVIAEATAYQWFASPAQIQGTLEHFDEFLIFKPEWAVSSAEGWRGAVSQIDAVRDGDSPGEIMITFHSSAPFMAIVVTPDRHEGTWRALSPTDGQSSTS